MKTFTIFIILCLLSKIVTYQDKFLESINNLETELGYYLQTDSIIQQSVFDVKWIKRFKTCSKHYDSFNKLNLKNITSVRTAELKQLEHTNHYYAQFTFQEWAFKNNEEATEFEEQLAISNSIAKKECLNKGGIKWWRIEKNLYFITSRAYYMTFKYDELMRVIQKHL